MTQAFSLNITEVPMSARTDLCVELELKGFLKGKNLDSLKKISHKRSIASKRPWDTAEKQPAGEL